MAKSKATLMDEQGYIPTSDVMAHINKQTFGADASTAIGEAIPNPGWSVKDPLGIVIVSAFLMQEPTAGKAMVIASDGDFVSQLQTGDRSASPALIEPDQPGFLAHRRLVAEMDTSGLTLLAEPLSLPVLFPQPFILTKDYTVVHRAVNVPAVNSTDIFTIIWFHTAEFTHQMYNIMLRQQQRTS